MTKTIARVGLGAFLGVLILAAILSNRGYDVSAGISDLYHPVGKWLALLAVVTLGVFLGHRLDRQFHRGDSPRDDGHESQKGTSVPTDRP
jgi:uncharacterized membrane-anchored protein